MTPTKRKAPEHAALYARISADADGRALGVERQLADLRKYADGQGWTCTEYIDNDVSASRYSKKARKAFDRMLADVDAGRIDVVVVVELSRYTRDPRLVEDVIDGKLHLVALDGEYDLTTARGKSSLRRDAERAVGYSDFISEKILRKKRALIECGEGTGGSRAFGYLGAAPGRKAGHVIDEREAAAIREAADAVLAGATLTSIADLWNAQGFRTPKTNSLWGVPSVRSVLTNPRHTGNITSGGEIIGPAQWPAVLPMDRHLRLCRLLNDPDRRKNNPPRRGLLTAKLECAVCGHRLRSDGRYYRCRKQPETAACGSTMIAAAPLDKLIVDAVLHRLSSPKVLKAMRKPRPKPNASPLDDVDAIQAELDALAEASGRGELPVREMLLARKPLEQRLAQATELAGAVDEADILGPLVSMDDIPAAWAALDTDRQRAVLDVLIATIKVSPAEARSFDPDRVDIAWRV